MKKVIVFLSLFLGLSLFASNANLAFEAYQKGDYKTTEKLLKEGCDSNDLESCNGLGDIYLVGNEELRGKIPQDIQKGLKLKSKACEGNYTKACKDLGGINISGKLVSKDIPKGIEYLTQACDDNDMEGCAIMGNIYINGLTDKDSKVIVPIDTIKGINYLAKSCDGGIKTDCVTVGNFYYKKNALVNQDFKKAKDFFTKACEKGDKQSCYTVEGLNLIKPISKTNSEEIIKHNGFEYKVIISPTTGRKWLDRNLEAKRSCKNNLDQECLGTLYVMDYKYPGYTQTRDLNNETWLKSDGAGVCPKGFKVPSGLVDFNLELETMGKDEFLKFLNLAYHEKNEKEDSVEHLWSSTVIDNNSWFLHYHKDKEKGNACKWNGFDEDRKAQIRCVEAN